MRLWYRAWKDAWYFEVKGRQATVGSVKSMNISTPLLWVTAAMALTIVGCDPAKRTPDPRDDPPSTKPVETRKVDMGKNVTLEVQGNTRRVLVNTTVCLQRGPLELLVCREQTKEHESILTADADARDIHRALLVAGAEPGKPAKYLEAKIQPPTGTKIKVSVRYEKKGELVKELAGRWIRNMRTLKQLDEDWVFAGSVFAKNELEPMKPDIYLANEGDMICVSNFEDAMLDLPIASSKDEAARAFEAFAERIPEVGTKVVVILEPVLETKRTPNR
jgi:hypothetical protein